MEYIGEHLWAGQLGNLFVIISFVAALLSTYSYLRSAKEQLLRVSLYLATQQ